VTIKKGEAWGEPGVLPSDGVVASTDREASRVLETARRQSEPFPVVGVSAGDLYRTLGGSGQMMFPIDVGELLVDGRHHYFVAHVVARTRGWGHAFVAMNAQWLGDWNLGPRAHPNDGVLDTYRADLGLFDRLKVRRRLPLGAHLPHPGIAGERGAAVAIELPRPLPVYVDGEQIGRGRTLALRVIPDALRVVA